jgi:hypothetical protein
MDDLYANNFQKVTILEKLNCFENSHRDIFKLIKMASLKKVENLTKFLFYQEVEKIREQHDEILQNIVLCKVCLNDKMSKCQFVKMTVCQNDSLSK